MQRLRTLACNPRLQAKLWPSLIVAVFFAVSLLSMRHQSLTYDEGDHLTYGQRILELNSNRIEAEILVPRLILGDGWRAKFDSQELKLVKGNKVQSYRVLWAGEANGAVLGVDDSKMPVSALNALPGKLASHLPVGRFQSSAGTLFAARFATVITALCLGYLCFHWSR
jgi:hypothetical protein